MLEGKIRKCLFFYVKIFQNNSVISCREPQGCYKGAPQLERPPKAWALPRFWVSILSYKKQPVKEIWDRILGLAWLKFAMVAPLYSNAKPEFHIV
jgi:hypothetical protein